MRELLTAATERAIRYLETLDGRGVAPDATAVARLAELDIPLPDYPSHADETLALLDSYSAATMAMAGSRFFGFVIGGVLPTTLAANWLAGAWDQNSALAAATPLTAKLEAVALRWLCEVLCLPPETGVGFVTGATMANLTCLAAARHAVLAQAGWDVEADGLFGAPEVTVVVGEEAHPTLFKSLGLAGFCRNRVVRVPVDKQGRMRADAFPTLAGPTIVCLQAGNVNTGAFDPASEIIPKAKAAHAWVHVDGAFGLWAAAAPSTAHLMAGYAGADSWATDAHKYLNTPYDCGLAFVRYPDALQAAMAVSAAYLPSGPTRDPANFTPELLRRARGIEVWAALHSLGRSGLADLIGRTCRHAARFAEGLRAAGYTILSFRARAPRLFAAVWSDKMHFKQAVPLNGTQSSRAHVRLFVAALLLIAGGAWLALALQARSMGLMPVTMGIAMPTFVVMWTLMVAAMMVPSITPLASRYLRTIESPRSFGLLGFTAGYLGLWTTTGVLAFALAWLAGRIAATSPQVATATAAAIFAIGGVYQFTPLKDRCLARCRVPIALLLRYASWRGSLRHLRVGVHHGAYCLGCCWSLMLLMLAFGVMNIGAMLLLAAIVTLEKVWTRGVLLSRLIGVACCILFVAVLWMPGLAPGLILPANGMQMPSP